MPKADMVAGSELELDYLVKHCTRHFIIAADSLNAFDDNVTLRDAMKYLPDQTSQTEALHDLTFARIKKEMGCGPIFLSCHLCFAHQFAETELEAFLNLDYQRLYTKIAKWEKYKAKNGYVEDSLPPNFYSLVKAALALVKAAKGAKKNVSPKAP